MTIDEAIITLQFHTEWLNTKKDREIVTACLLGLGALKQWKIYRSGGVPSQETLLPGETE